MKSNFRLGTAALLSGILVSILCFLTALPGVGFIDSGEMAAAAATLGIPHPTGYPLLMMLGNLSTLIFPWEPIIGLNVLNGLLTGASAFFLVLLFARFLRTIPALGEDVDWGMRLILIPVVTALLVATGTIWWSLGTGFEAYGLHALFLALLCWSFLRWVDAIHAENEQESDSARRQRTRRTGFLFALMLGLSFSNHMTTIILAPAFLLHYGLVAGLNRGSFGRLLRLLPPFLIGLLPYIYLPIRAASSPALNWGQPDNLERFLYHVMGGQYQGLMFNVDVVGQQLGWFFTILPGEFVWVGLLLVVPGVAYLYRRGRRRLLFASVLFLTSLLFAGTYAIREIEPYFLTALLAVGLLIASGGAWLQERIRPQLLFLLLLLPPIGIALHYGEVDRSEESLAETFARDLLNGLPRNSLLLTTRWDYLISPTLFVQYASGVRPDVTVANLNMLHDRVYLSQLVGRHPGLGRARSQIEGFLQARRAWDEGELVDARAYHRAFTTLVNGLIAAYNNPVYVTSEVDTLIGLGLRRVPHNLAIALREGDEYLPQDTPRWSIRVGPGPDLVDRVGVSLHYGEMLDRRAAYEAEMGRMGNADLYRKLAGAFRPSLDEEDVPVLPLGNQEYVRRVMEWFGRRGG